MQKLLSFVYVLSMSVIFLGTLPVQGMECTSHYNSNSPLFLLPKETLDYVLSYCQERDDKPETEGISFKNSLKTFVKLSATCTAFNTFLTPETIGTFCTSYTQDVKNNHVEALFFYKLEWDSMRHFLSLLVRIGADANIRSNRCEIHLLGEAVEHNDLQLVETLLKHHAYLDVKYRGAPVLFHAKTLPIVHMLVEEGGIDIHTTVDGLGCNLLCKVIDVGYPSEVMEFYLKHNVGARQFHPSSCSRACLLHTLAFSDIKITDTDDFLKKATLLLNAIPDMINVINDGKTPLDVAYYSLDQAKRRDDGTAAAFEQLIALFKKCGGVKAKEFMAQKSASQEETQKKVNLLGI